MEHSELTGRSIVPACVPCCTPIISVEYTNYVASICQDGEPYYAILCVQIVVPVHVDYLFGGGLTPPPARQGLARLYHTTVSFLRHEDVINVPNFCSEKACRAGPAKIFWLPQD